MTARPNRPTLERRELLRSGGISLVGLVTATLASWIVQRVSEDDDANQAATAAHIEELRQEIRRLTGDGAPYGEGRGRVEGNRLRRDERHR